MFTQLQDFSSMKSCLIKCTKKVFSLTSYFSRLHKLLLQPRGVKQAETSTKTREQTTTLKGKRIVGKIRVEGLTFSPWIITAFFFLSI